MSAPRKGHDRMLARVDPSHTPWPAAQPLSLNSRQKLTITLNLDVLGVEVAHDGLDVVQAEVVARATAMIRAQFAVLEVH